VCDRDWRVKLLDFGIATRPPEAIAEELTQSRASLGSGGPAGTPAYMAPELLRGQPADQRTDLWSLGVLLHELLTGQLPFSGRTGFELASAILQNPPPPLPESTPEPLAGVVRRLLSKEPGDRFRHAGELRAVLESLQESAPRVNRVRRRIRTIVFAALATALAGVTAFTWWRATGHRPLTLSEHRLISTTEGSHRAPSCSPDGSMVAFAAADVDGVSQIWIKNLAQGDPIKITSGSEPAERPRWSPKNDQILYAVTGQGVWSVSPLGGAPRRLIEQGTNPNFSRDGSRLVFEDERGILTASADGSNVRRVDGTPPSYYWPLPMGPSLSPDGSMIAFFHPDLGPNGDFWVLPAKGGTARRLTNDLREGGWPTWTPDGHAIVFSSARAGSRTLWQVPVQGGEPVALTSGAGEDDQPDLTPDGRHVIFTNTRNTWELRVHDLSSGSERRLLERRTEMLFPRFSPDGTRIAFFGRADFAVAIFTIGADGSDLRQLTDGRELNYLPRWGPDGRFLYFFQSQPTVTFRRIPALGGPSTAFRNWDWQIQNAPLFDPTGRYIAYLKQRPMGAPMSVAEHLVFHEVATGREREVPEPHVHPGGWSPDGKAVVGWRHDGKIVVCPLEGEICRPVTEGVAPTWSGDGTHLFFLRPAANRTSPQELWSTTVEGSDERRALVLGTFRAIDRFFDLSKDGLVVWAPFRAGRSELWSATVK
jgi:eukaryotic-like serine/threonine-protein kinase